MVMSKLSLFALLILAAGTLTARAAVVTLDMQANAATNTWDLYATVSNDTRGLASFNVDVIGSGGATITSSTLKAPRPLNAAQTDFAGFNLFRNSGTTGVDIRASQDTVSGDASLILLDQGIATPIYLASGTFSGTTGLLTASLHQDGLFNVFPSGYVTGGATSAAPVVGDSVAVPEPSMIALLGVAAVALGRRRRNS